MIDIPVSVFVILSLPIIWVSRRSLRHPTSHGFFRFFAFEAVLALIMMNFPYWFLRAGSLPQLFSWLLLGISIVFVAWAFVLLRRLGGFEAAGNAGDAENATPQFAWENTEHLVTTGIYRYIRHPMYSSLLFLTWGAVLKSVTVAALVLAALASLALFATAKAEEVENLTRFGQEYEDYMKRSCRFVPFVL